MYKRPEELAVTQFYVKQSPLKIFSPRNINKENISDLPSSPKSPIKSPIKSPLSTMNGVRSPCGKLINRKLDFAPNGGVPVTPGPLLVSTETPAKEILSKKSEHVNVYLRVRPLPREEEEESVTIIDEHTVEFRSAKQISNYMVNEGGDRYTFNKVFSQVATQLDVYEKTAKPHVEGLFEGKNSLLFAYGVTNAGKTYTMMGKLQYSNSDEGTPVSLKKTTTQKKKSVSMKRDGNDGIIPRVLEEIFDIIEEKRIDGDAPHEQYILSVSYFELYNEKIYDLLNEVEEESRDSVSVSFLAGDANNRRRKNLKIGEDHGKVYVKDLRSQEVENASEGRLLLMRGNRNRQVGQTNLNAESSRSHAIFTLNLQLKNAVMGTIVDVGKMSIVDLAGAERAGKTKVQGDRLKEAGGINKSLLVLGRCLSAIQFNQRNGNNPNKKLQSVPIRESEITKLFRNELQGEAAVTMIVNVSSSMFDSDETANVMKYSAIAKDIKTSSRVDTYRKVAATHSIQPFVSPRILASPTQLRKQLPTYAFNRPNPVKLGLQDESNDEIEALREHVRQLEDIIATRYASVNSYDVEQKVRAEAMKMMQRQEEEREKAMREQQQQEALGFENKLERVKKLMQKQIDRCQQETEQALCLEEEWRLRSQSESLRVEQLQKEVMRLNELLEAERCKRKETQLSSQYQNEIQKITDDHQRQVRELTEIEESKRLDLELQHKRARLDFQREIDMLKDQLAKYAKVERELTRLEQRFQKLQSENEELKITHATELEAQKKKMYEMERSMNQQFAAEKEKLVTELTIKHRSEIESRHAITRQHADIEIQSIRAHLQQETRIKDALSNVLRDMKKKSEANLAPPQSPIVTSPPHKAKSMVSSIIYSPYVGAVHSPSNPESNKNKSFFEKIKRGTKRNSDSLGEEEGKEKTKEERPKKRRLIRNKNSEAEAVAVEEGAKEEEKKSIRNNRSRVKLAAKSSHDEFFDKEQGEESDDSEEEVEETPKNRARGRPPKKNSHQSRKSRAKKLINGVKKLVGKGKTEESSEEETVIVDVFEQSEEEEKPKRRTRASRRKN